MDHTLVCLLKSLHWLFLFSSISLTYFSLLVSFHQQLNWCPWQGSEEGLSSRPHLCFHYNAIVCCQHDQDFLNSYIFFPCILFIFSVECNWFCFGCCIKMFFQGHQWYSCHESSGKISVLTLLDILTACDVADLSRGTVGLGFPYFALLNFLLALFCSLSTFS